MTNQNAIRTCHWFLAPGKLSDSRHGLGKCNDDRCPVNRITGAVKGTPSIVFSWIKITVCPGNANYVNQLGDWIELLHRIINPLMIWNCQKLNYRKIRFPKLSEVHITMQCACMLQCCMVKNRIVADRCVHFATLMHPGTSLWPTPQKFMVYDRKKCTLNFLLEII